MDIEMSKLSDKRDSVTRCDMAVLSRRCDMGSMSRFSQGTLHFPGRGIYLRGRELGGKSG